MNGLVAVIDIDVHHGNGTQGIFYARPDVFTVSIHADPADYFPFYAGYADETGMDGGTGFNRNFPLPLGSEDAPWLAAIEEALDLIAAHRPAALVVALGLDASKDDPIGALKVTQKGFADAASAIGRLRVPTAIIQEGAISARPCRAISLHSSKLLTKPGHKQSLLRVFRRHGQRGQRAGSDTHLLGIRAACENDGIRAPSTNPAQAAPPI